jgi:hypothetical protein
LGPVTPYLGCKGVRLGPRERGASSALGLVSYRGRAAAHASLDGVAAPRAMERTMASNGRYRCLSKDDEYLPESSAAMISLAMSWLMLHRLARRVPYGVPPARSFPGWIILWEHRPSALDT